ncbi:MAG: class I SAM-dependent methyltransferase [Thermoprotei archaeon]
MLRLIKRWLFRIIYRTYLWASEASNESYLGSRSVEYPFIIEELRKSLIPEGSKILLVGCAGDPLSTILPALGYETYGLDVKHVAIRYPNFHFVKGDIRRTDFLNNYFDVVIAVSTIEHVGVLEDDFEGDHKAVKEIARILKSGGLLLVTCPVAFKAKVTPYERIYNPYTLKALFSEFAIKSEKFFKKRNGYWLECAISELSNGEEAVCCISALKPRGTYANLTHM